jgi:hypothetical protein
MAITGSQTATVKPATSGAYLAASALYNAGFRGWALTIMTAIAGRESNWNPSALNNTPATGDYSVGLTQLNYYGDLYSSRVASYGTPSSLSANPQAQANASFNLAGGNSLSGLGNWALSPSPAAGTIPSPTKNGYSIVPWLAQAATAVSMVGSLGPASASQIANENSWPATPADTSAQLSALPATLTAAISSGSGGGNGGCGALGNVFTGTSLPLVGSIFPTFTRCEAKGLLGGVAIAGGGALIVTGLALLIVAAGKGQGPLSPVVQTASAVRSLPLIRRVGTGS